MQALNDPFCFCTYYDAGYIGTWPCPTVRLDLAKHGTGRVGRIPKKLVRVVLSTAMATSFSRDSVMFWALIFRMKHFHERRRRRLVGGEIGCLHGGLALDVDWYIARRRSGLDILSGYR